jgi:hypothetical protein
METLWNRLDRIALVFLTSLGKHPNVQVINREARSELCPSAMVLIPSWEILSLVEMGSRLLWILRWNHSLVLVLLSCGRHPHPWVERSSAFPAAAFVGWFRMNPTFTCDNRRGRRSYSLRQNQPQPSSTAALSWLCVFRTKLLCRMPSGTT